MPVYKREKIVYNYYLEKGMTKKDIIKQIAKDRNVKKDEIYKYFLDK